MSRRLTYALVALVAILIALGIAGVYYWPQAVEASFPQIDGQITLPGLDAPVDIYRDSMGVPHIYASTEHDLFFAQGYVHAQDRFWQMDFWRHQGAGRISELLGAATLDADKFINTLGWERIAKQELADTDPATIAMLESYSAGVNAYLADHQGTALSLEYLFLPIVNRGYQPAPWEPLHTLTWAKAMAWDLASNMDNEIDRALLLDTLTAQQVADLYPPYPADRPVIVPNPHITEEASNIPDSLPTLAIAASTALRQVEQQFAALYALRGSGFDGIGSNSWVISGNLSETGMPLLANDPHLGAQMPSIWYEVGLHCAPKGPDCQYEATGFSFAGVPGVVIGHNQRIAWGLTNVGPDVMDLYIEKINPENPNQYEYQGEWVDMEIITKTIQVANGDPVELTVRSTRHGPIITEVYELEEFGQQAGIEVPENYAIALRWTALEPSQIFRAVWSINRAQNWDEFRTAVQEFVVPAQNFVYADADGNIGYQMPGNIPLRAEGHDGLLPVPGWTGEYEWRGYIPFEELPFSYNPPEGYIVTANNAVVGSEYPYLITKDWSYGFRAQAIVDMLEDAPQPITIAYIQQMQGDNRNLIAETLVPILLDISLNDQNAQEARQLLQNWDFQNDMESAPAALFAAFWRNLLVATFADDLPEDYEINGGGTWKELVRQISSQAHNAWWDNQTTPTTETRDDIFRDALVNAVDELRDTLGKDPQSWAWGELHTLTLAHSVMTNFPLADRVFNRGPFPTAGGSNIVNATSWDANQSYEVSWLPSMRMIVDLGNLNNSLVIHTTGQSGHTGHPHYIDMVDLWRNIQYRPMHWQLDDIQADAEGHLQLLP